MILLLSIFLIVEAIISVFIIWNLLRKLDVATSENESLYNTMVELYGDLHKSFSEMKHIDHRGGFESDDETGSIFKQLKEVMDRLESKYGTDTD
jgi:methyl-accepting chemotaxis protein